MRRHHPLKFSFTLLTLLASATFTSAQDAAAQKAAEKANESGNWLFWGLATLFVFVVLFLVAVLGRMKGLDGAAPEPHLSFRQWWSTLDHKLFTRAVPVEKEADVLLDHDYDGIKELDNALPPWWKYGFYITVVIAVFYFLRFHVWHTGLDPQQEYNKEMQDAAAQIEAYRKQSNEMVDEKTVTLSDAAGIAAGQKIFQSNCFACHGQKGEGGVGPNLTDNYWLHGGSLNDVFKTIKYGVPEKGMQAWEKTYAPSQIKDLSSFILSLKGTNPPNGKAPQGEPYTEVKPDSTAQVKDSSLAVKR